MCFGPNLSPLQKPSTEEEIQYVMNFYGISWVEADHRLNMADCFKKQNLENFEKVKAMPTPHSDFEAALTEFKRNSDK